MIMKSNSRYNITHNEGSLLNLLSKPKKQKKIKYSPNKYIPIECKIFIL